MKAIRAIDAGVYLPNCELTDPVVLRLLHLGANRVIARYVSNGVLIEPGMTQ